MLPGDGRRRAGIAGAAVEFEAVGGRVVCEEGDLQDACFAILYHQGLMLRHVRIVCVDRGESVLDRLVG